MAACYGWLTSRARSHVAAARRRRGRLWCCVAGYRPAAPNRTTALRGGGLLLSLAFVELCATGERVGQPFWHQPALAAGFC